MEYIQNQLDYTIKEDTVITLGKFDGLHRGHELLMNKMFEKSRECGYSTVVFTFDIPPRRQADGESARVLTTNEEKRCIFEKTGVDYLFECPFTREIMSMPPERFIRWIAEAFHVRCIVVGNDFHFGHNRAGDYRMLQAYADSYGYEVIVLEKMKEDGRDISSSFVREEILKGRIEKANRLLGYEFFVLSSVVSGRKLGRRLGIPTINMEFDADKLLPPNGVYMSRVLIDGKDYPGVTNVGCKPTVSDSGRIVVETHIVGYAGDLYERRLAVRFLRFIRPEMHFASVEELQRQMRQDIEFVTNLLRNELTS